MTAVCLCFAFLAGAGFYLASPHQRLRPGWRTHAKRLRMVATIAALLSMLAAIHMLGVWAGVFVMLTVLMLVCVALPYVDAWRELRRERRHVG